MTRPHGELIVPVINSSAHALYSSTLEALLNHGAKVSTRGYETLEIQNFITGISPHDHCHFVPGRRWNPWVALSEALWILAGRNDLACLLPYNKRMAEFSDDGKTLYGAYGYRISDQIQPLLNRLKRDPNDRRAVLSIWEKRDLNAVTKDPPCNDMIMFKLRENKLHMTVMNRSNDLHWGLYGVNLPTFGILQDYLAACMQVEMGNQVHISNSLHIYTGGPGMKENYNITQRMMARINEDLPEMPWHKKCFTEPVSLDTLQGACSDILDAKNDGRSCAYVGKIDFLEFADDFLAAYRHGVVVDNDTCRHSVDYQDWVMAARIWREEGEDRFK